MQITRKDIANYYLLEEMIEKSKKKLQSYIEKMPSEFAGKVRGSNVEFPFQPVGFSVYGFTKEEMQEKQKWECRCRDLEEEIQQDIKRMNEIKAEIDCIIANADDIQDKAILQYTLERKPQQWIAQRVGLDQSAVSRRIKKYVK